MRIVYVEDNIANVHLVKRVARMGQHEIINYIDGMDALNNFDTDQPDLVLMDIQLAGELTGIEVVKKLRDKGFDTPIFAVTAYAMVGDKERCMEAGCTGYMSKPIPVTDLVNLFQKYEKPSQPDPVADTKAEDTSVNKQPTVDEKPTETQAKKPVTEPSKSPEEKADQPVATSVDTPEEETEQPTAKTDSTSTSETITEVPSSKPVVDETATQEAPATPSSESVAKTSSDNPTANQGDDDDSDVTKPNREVLNKEQANTETEAEGADKLAEEDTPASITSSSNDDSDPQAKMI